MKRRVRRSPVAAGPVTISADGLLEGRMMAVAGIWIEDANKSGGVCVRVVGTCGREIQFRLTTRQAASMSVMAVTGLGGGVK